MAYEEFSRIYDKLIKEDINYKEITKRILSIASDNSINMDDYLDLACGTGNVSCLLSDKFKNTYLVDMSYDMLSEANNKNGTKVELLIFKGFQIFNFSIHIQNKRKTAKKPPLSLSFNINRNWCIFSILTILIIACRFISSVLTVT